MIFNAQKMPRTKRGKFEGTKQWDMYQRHGVGAITLIFQPSVAAKSCCTLAMSAQWRPRIEADG